MTHLKSLSVLLAALALTACGGSDGLTAQGTFRVTAETFDTAITLTQESRLDLGGRVTGSCEIHESGGVRSAIIDLYANGDGATNQLRHASITGVLGESELGLMAQIGSDTYSRSDCAASIDLIDLDGNVVVSTTGDCELSSGTDTIDTNVDLALFGCRVITE
jgi:hypothetical protein